MATVPNSPPLSLSLLAGGVQADLIPVEELDDGFWDGDEIATGASKPNYTAVRFFRKRPEDYRRCVELLAAKKDLRGIAGLLKVHHRTVAAVRERESRAIDTYKQTVIKNLRLACEVLSDRLVDSVLELSARDAPLAFCQLVDKVAYLEGEPTARIAITVDGKLTHAAVNASLVDWPEAIEIEAQLIGLAAPDPRAKEGEAKQLVESQQSRGAQ